MQVLSYKNIKYLKLFEVKYTELNCSAILDHKSA